MVPMLRTCIVGLTAAVLAVGCKGKAAGGDPAAGSDPAAVTESDPKALEVKIDAAEHELAAATKLFANAQTDGERDAAKKQLIELTKKRRALVARYETLRKP